MYTDQEKETIFNLRDADVPWETIGSILKKNPSALRTWHSRNRVNRGLPPPPKVSKSMISGRTALAIKKLTAENLSQPVRSYEAPLKEALAPGTPIPKKSTVHNFLKKNGYVVKRALKKPLVSARNQLRRLEFARLWKNDVHTLVHTTVWSDETMVYKQPKGKDLFIRCHSSTPRENMPLNIQLQQGGFSVMFWGCFSILGLGPLVALNGTQNQETYVQLLQEYLLPELKAAEDEFGTKLVFMHDNATCHKADSVTDFLRQNGVSTLEWPPQSPDLNPIENLWAIVKKRRQQKFGIPRSKNDLIEQVFSIWEELDQELLKTLAESVKNRLRLILKSKGKITRY